MEATAIDYSDVQGLVRFGFGKMTKCAFFLVRIKEVAAARAWLASAPVTNAVEMDPPPPKALQIALTCEGLAALGVPSKTIAGFAPEFVSGMSEESRSRRLGDVGANSPDSWHWGYGESVPHLLIMIYSEPGLEKVWEQSVKGNLWDEAFQTLECLPTSHLGEVEPFGFVDGISQPQIDWDRTRDVSGDQLEYSNLSALGEFLLGYPNEYGKYTDRPVIDSDEDVGAQLLPGEDHPAKKDLGRNGTYLVMRQLQQDVRGFWRFLDKEANSSPTERQRLAEAMVGRGMNGAPLVPLSTVPIGGVGPDDKDCGFNQFTYQSDIAGTQCPLGAHIRRANPRNADFPKAFKGLISRLVHLLGFGRKHFRDDLIAATRFHRILRRGREYGPGLLPEEALQPAPFDDSERGLHFVCLNSNIARQFEFVQNAWIMSTKFDGLTEESDPLLGNRQPVSGCVFSDTFSFPQERGIRRRITKLPQFVIVRGGAYFFLPSLRALRYFVRVGQ